MSQPYELLYLVSTQVTEEDLPKLTKKIRQIIESQSGLINKDEMWAKRKLAYSIKQHRQAYYWLVEFDASGEVNKKVVRELKLIPEIIRFILAKRLNYQPVRELEDKPQIVKPSIRPPLKTTERKEDLSVKGDKVSLEDLDRKLDEILDDNINEN